MRLTLNTLENTRKTLARIIRKYEAGDMERLKYRDLTYGLNIYLAFFKTEKDEDYEKRIKALEEARE